MGSKTELAHWPCSESFVVLVAVVWPCSQPVLTLKGHMALRSPGPAQVTLASTLSLHFPGSTCG